MKLIGQYDSPFVRRVGVALQHYGLAYEHLAWSTFGDGDRFSHHNPLKRVPTLVLADGEVLIESGAILDHLDELAGRDCALIPQSGRERRHALRRIALATGAADKAVSYFYAKQFATGLDARFRERCESQIRQTLTVLEQECSDRARDWWQGIRPGHDDIAVACVVRFLGEAYADLYNPAENPALSAHCARAEALTIFAAVQQAFIPPK